MKRLLLMCATAVLIVFLIAAPLIAKSKRVQKPVVAGTFYPASKRELRAQVRRFLAEAPRRSYDGRVIGVISPHAGYRYSGVVAGAAFRQLQDRGFTRAIVIAPAHRAPIAGMALLDADAYETPLGKIPIDRKAVQSFAKKHAWASIDAKPFQKEHALEVEFPFLQEALGAFTLVPILAGRAEKETLDAIAEAIRAELLDERTALVISSDLSHYHSYAQARKRDRATLELICEKKAAPYLTAVQTDKVELCGALPVYLMKRIVEAEGGSLELIEYANSGDTAGDRSRVVGYAALAAVVPGGMLTTKQKGKLLALARGSVEAHVRGKKLPPLPKDAVLKREGAAFVTLRKKGELRGCIGQIIATGPLDQAVQKMAVAASSNDPRFSPVRLDELGDLSVEVSVLTPPEPLPDPRAVRLGTDGLIVEKRMHRGVLLPQVPTEQGWTKHEYLAGICRKAGLPPACWKDARLERFQAIVFGEHE